MNISTEQYEETIMNLIVYGGDARSYAIEAMQAARAGNFDQADAGIKSCEKALEQAHNIQTEILQSEARGEHVPVILLMVHAQDHLMNAMTVKDLAEEVVWLHKMRHTCN